MNSPARPTPDEPQQPMSTDPHRYGGCDTLKVTVTDRVMTVLLNRPEQLNAFTVAMAHELIDLFTSASDDNAVGAVVVSGEGRAFCAGMDLAACEGNVFGLNEALEPTMQDLRERYEDPEIVDGVRDLGGRLALVIHACKKPVIAAINGAAVGVGVTMTLAMDVRLASEGARFGFVFGRLGVVPEACSTWFLPRLVGLSQALDWVYSARIFDAREALAARLVSAVHAPEDLLAAAQALAASYVSGRSGVSVALMRQMMLRNSAEASPDEAHRVESLAMFYTSREDGREGVQAFLEKRPPAFSRQAGGDMPPFYPW
jgi:enoyl-CoA hydratase/carnithine racemase